MRKASGKEIRVETDGKDRYGRVIGTLFVEGKNVNLAMVEQGLAWHYAKYSDSQALAGAEKAARAAQKGLWGAQGQVAPLGLPSEEESA